MLFEVTAHGRALAVHVLPHVDFISDFTRALAELQCSLEPAMRAGGDLARLESDRNCVVVENARACGYFFKLGLKEVQEIL